MQSFWQCSHLSTELNLSMSLRYFKWPGGRIKITFPSLLLREKAQDPLKETPLKDLKNCAISRIIWVPFRNIWYTLHFIKFHEAAQGRKPCTNFLCYYFWSTFYATQYEEQNFLRRTTTALMKRATMYKVCARREIWEAMSNLITVK